jgi:hypothetical protein
MAMPHSVSFVLKLFLFFRVRLAYNVKTREAVAVKIVDTRGKHHVKEDVKKEVGLFSSP